MRTKVLLTVGLGISAPLFGGCPAGEQVVDAVVDDLLPSTSAVAPVGTTKDELIVSKLDAASLAATRTICGLNIESGVQEEIAIGISSATDQLIANEAYVAWLDAGGNAVQALERSTGGFGTIFTAATGVTNVVGLVGDVLILHRGNGTVFQDRTWDFRLINLATTDNSTIETSWANGNFAYDGRYFALLNDENITADPNRPGVLANLDVLDTQTDTRTRVAEAISVADSGGGLFIDEGLVLWVELNEDGSRVVRSYNPADETIRIAASNLEGELLDVQGGDFLTLTTSGNALLLETKAIDFGGQRQVTYSFTVRDDQVFDLLPRLVGDTVVWFDPFTGEVTVGN